jgi:hypothetical protein
MSGYLALFGIFVTAESASVKCDRGGVAIAGEGISYLVIMIHRIGLILHNVSAAIIAAPLGVATLGAGGLVLINEGKVAFAFNVITAPKAYLNVLSFGRGDGLFVRVTVRGNNDHFGDDLAANGTSDVLAVTVLIAACVFTFDGNG